MSLVPPNLPPPSNALTKPRAAPRARSHLSTTWLHLHYISQLLHRHPHTSHPLGYIPQTHSPSHRQAAVRGFIWRLRIKRDSEMELIFVGMKPKVGGGGVHRCAGAPAKGCIK